MATLAFHKDGDSYVSDTFQGGKAIQLSFPSAGTQVLFTESRLGVTLPWAGIDGKITERTMIVNVPQQGEGQEFRLRCMAEPSSAEIVTASSGSGGGGQLGPDSVGSEEIADDSIMMEDLNQTVKDQMMTGEDRVTQEELDNFQP